MKYFLLSNFKIRSQYQRFEIQQKILKVLIFNNQLSSAVKRKLIWQYSRLCFLFSFSFIKNKCILTGRSRSIITYFNLSRLIIKFFFKLKYIPNLLKSSW